MSDVQLHKMVVTCSSEVIKVMTAFYKQAFKEIDASGFNLRQLNAVKSVIQPDQMAAFESQISKLQLVGQVIGQEIPSVKVLEDFYELLVRLSKTKDEKLPPGVRGD